MLWGRPQLGRKMERIAPAYAKPPQAPGHPRSGGARARVDRGARPALHELRPTAWSGQSTPHHSQRASSARRARQRRHRCGRRRWCVHVFAPTYAVGGRSRAALKVRAYATLPSCPRVHRSSNSPRSLRCLARLARTTSRKGRAARAARPLAALCARRAAPTTSRPPAPSSKQAQARDVASRTCGTPIWRRQARSERYTAVTSVARCTAIWHKRSQPAEQTAPAGSTQGLGSSQTLTRIRNGKHKC